MCSLINHKNSSLTPLYPKSNNKCKNEVNNKNIKILFFASQNNHLYTIKSLKELNVDFNQKDKYGLTALMYASQKGYFSIVQYLIQCNVELNEMDNHGLTALMYASLNGHISIVTHLIFKGAKIDIRDHEGSTALFYATSSNHFDIVQYLIEHGADHKIYNNNNVTAFMIATSKSYNNIAYYLLNYPLSRNMSYNMSNKNDNNNINYINININNKTYNNYNNFIQNNKGNLKVNNSIKKKISNNRDDNFNIFSKKLNSKKSIKSFKILECNDKNNINDYNNGISNCAFNTNNDGSIFLNHYNSKTIHRYNSINSIIDEFKYTIENQNLYRNKNQKLCHVSSLYNSLNSFNYKNNIMKEYPNKQKKDKLYNFFLYIKSHLKFYKQKN